MQEIYLSVLKVRENKSNPRSKRNFLYRGMIKCAKTNRLLTAETHKGSHNSGTYVYYRCPKDCQHCENCKQFVKEETINEAVELALQQITVTPEQLQEFKILFKDMLNVQTKRDEKLKETISGQITKLKNRINQLYDDKPDGIISEEVYFDKKKKWEVALEEKTIQFSSLSKTNLELIKRFEKMSEPLKNLYGTYLRLSDEKKRILLKIISPNLFYNGSKTMITINRAFETLFKFIIFENGAGNATWLQPLANIIIHELDKMSIVEMLCCA